MQINYNRDKYLSEFSIKTLEDRYLIGDEKSPQEAFARAARSFSDNDAHAQRLYDYASKLWFMFSTPVLSNGGSARGLPISCFLNYVDDSREGITDHYTENAFLSSVGGGVGGCWSGVRSVGSKTSNGSESTGVIPFMKVVDAEMLAFSQGVTRSGIYAAYLDISDPEIARLIFQAEGAFRGGYYNAALSIADSAIFLNPKLADIHFLKGRVLTKLSRFAEAEDAYYQVISIDNKYQGAWFNIGTNNLRQNKVPQAIYNYFNEMNEHPSAQTMVQIGKAYSDLGKACLLYTSDAADE